MISVRSTAALLASLLLAAVAHAQSGSASRGPARPSPACHAVTPETCATAKALGRGINLGNMLEAPTEGQWGVKLEPGYIDIVGKTFTTVRLPVRWSNNAAKTADATLDEAFAKKVDQAVDALLAKGVYVILNMHHYSQLSGSALHWNEFAVEPEVLEPRLINMWRQIALRYKDRSPKLLFELLNEPTGRLDGEPWNQLSPQVLAAVRASNPTRTVLIGPGEWNGIPALPKLRLPPDRHLIVSIHNYDPFPFTHQGVEHLAKLFPVGATCCDAAQRKELANALDSAHKWSHDMGYPLHLGEFGTHHVADIKSREAYARMVRDEAERRGIGWTYWEFASPAFGMYSPKTGIWLEPIRRALLE
ncbi:MAG: glycoside hydrolase family 5 protein [Ramlibacter sp.]|nr:glycoside hydrolase family 5 protein [Ramlibacter sp.]